LRSQYSHKAMYTGFEVFYMYLAQKMSHVSRHKLL